jgi:microsomal dipeptidase-like Zn-dependent dipeptidase
MYLFTHVLISWPPENNISNVSSESKPSMILYKLFVCWSFRGLSMFSSDVDFLEKYDSLGLVGFNYSYNNSELF